MRAYNELSKVERAVRSLKTVDLKVRPIYQWLKDRVRAHVLLCMLAYYVEWHLRGKLKPILFEDEQRQAVDPFVLRSSLRPPPGSALAKHKDQSKHTADGLPIHSFQGLLANLGTLCKNLVRASGPGAAEFYMLTNATELQQRAFELLGVSPSG